MTEIDPTNGARDEAVGRAITAVCFVHDFIEIHLDEVIVTGRTKPFGLVMCGPPRPDALVALIGAEVDDFVGAPGKYVAIDSGESRIAFPIGGDTATGPESVRMFKPARVELGERARHWIS